MVWVNLLPWRAMRLRRERRYLARLLVLLAIVTLSAGLPTLGKKALNRQVGNLVLQSQKAGQRLEQQFIRLAEAGQEKKRLQQQWKARQRRQQILARWSSFVFSLAQAMPDTLWLSGISHNANSLTLSGFCRGMGDLDTFSQRLRQMSLVAQVKTGQLSRGVHGNVAFSLLIALRQQREAHE